MKNRIGFTLLEVIVAIAILSMVALIIGSGFRLGVKAWEKGEAKTQETQRLRVLSGLILQGLKSAYPYKMEINGEKVVVFEGSVHSIMFVTAMVGSSKGGFKWVRYSFRDGSLMFTEGILPDKGFLDKISKNEEVIASDVKEVKFEYLSSDENEWKESWELGEGLPLAVRVRIAYFQPFLIVIPMGLKDDETDKLQIPSSKHQ